MKKITQKHIKEWCEDFIGDLDKESISMLTSYINYLIQKALKEKK